MSRIKELGAEVTAKQQAMGQLQKSLNDSELATGFDDFKSMEDELIRMDDELKPLEARYNRMAEIESRETTSVMAKSADGGEKSADRKEGSRLDEYNRSSAEELGVPLADATLDPVDQFMKSEQMKPYLRSVGGESGELMLHGLLDQFKPTRTAQYRRDVVTGSGIQGVVSGGAERFQGTVPNMGYTPDARDITGMLSVIPRRAVSSGTFTWQIQTAKIAGYPTAEGAAPTESAWASNKHVVDCERVRAIQMITEDALEDWPEVEAILFDDARNGIMENWNSQLISGTGAANGQLGFSAPRTPDTMPRFGMPGTSGAQRLNATLQDRILWETINEGQRRVMMEGDANVTAVVVNPDVFFPARVEYDDNGGGWIFSNPADPLAMRAWGIPIIPSSGFPARAADAVALVMGDFSRYCWAATVGDVSVEIGYTQNGFSTWTKCIRASVRTNLVVTRPKAFYLGTWSGS